MAGLQKVSCLKSRDVMLRGQIGKKRRGGGEAEGGDGEFCLPKAENGRRGCPADHDMCVPSNRVLVEEPKEGEQEVLRCI